jgi:hypothetical protein
MQMSQRLPGFRAIVRVMVNLIVKFKAPGRAMTAYFAIRTHQSRFKMQEMLY